VLAGPPLGVTLFQTLSIGLGLLLLAGVWTPDYTSVGRIVSGTVCLITCS
jgi:hypothetical protein